MEKKLFAAASAVLLCVVILWGIKNEETLEFSYPAGAYAETLFLELNASPENAEVYYTLDGSTPTLQSERYMGDGIFLSDRTAEPDRYTKIWCTPADFLPGEGNFYGGEPQYKATVVTARLYLPKQERWSEKVWRSTYLIDADYTMPVVSLSLPEELLFDEDTGIYVPGQKMEEYLNSNTARAEDARLWQGNYSLDQRVNGYLEYFENGSRVMDQEVELRICGSASRGNGQKSFAVYASGEQTEFSYPIFGEDCQTLDERTRGSFTSFRLRAFGNDWRRSMFRDALSQELVKEQHLGTQAYQPCILLINGEYFGVYELRENRDKQFFKDHFGIQEGNLVKLELFGLTEETADADGLEFLELIESAEAMDLSQESAYAWLEERLDIGQLIDYLLVEQYLYNVDWPLNNVIAFRSRKSGKDTAYEDGRWRFVLYDLDYAINYPEEDNYAKLRASESYVARLLNVLLQNEEFRVAYAARFEELLETVFEPSYALNIQEQFENEFAPEIEETLKRWNIYREDGSPLKEVTVDYWYEKMNDLKDFFVRRPEYARAYFYQSLENND